MNTRLQVQTKATPKPSFIPGGRNLLSHRSTEQAEPPLVPPILHEALPTFQAKLNIGQPNDQYEQEADRVAEQVMRMPEPKIQRVCPECEEELQRQPLEEEEEEEETFQTKPLAEQITPLVQRQAEPMEEEEEEETLQTKTTSGQLPTVSSSLQNRIIALQVGGQPLPQSERAFFEPRFGADFSQVRVHADSQAAEAASAINARALTVGQNIAFGAGQYTPDTTKGRYLIAHELTHTIQQSHQIPKSNTNRVETHLSHPGGIQRQPMEEETLPEINTRGPFWEKAIKYQPILPEKKEVKISLPPPPISKESPLLKKCPDPKTAQKAIIKMEIAKDTEKMIQKTINLERARSSVHQAFKLTKKLLKKSEGAIRQEFGTLLPSRPSFASPSTLSIKSPDEFVKHRIPDAQAARQLIGEIALKTNPNILRKLCITKPNDQVLRSTVVDPLFNKLKIGFIREYEKSRIGGETAHTYSGGKWSRHVTIPNAHRNMGHILVYEAMHYYVHDTFLTTAQGHSLDQQLTEGGAEYLARRVIHQRLSDDPAFKVNYGAYASEFRYIITHLAKRSFPVAYFQGHVELLGLTPRTTLKTNR